MKVNPQERQVGPWNRQHVCGRAGKNGGEWEAWQSCEHPVLVTCSGPADLSQI